jgi:hypothetical protein
MLCPIVLILGLIASASSDSHPTPIVPHDNGVTQLPLPAANLSLKHVTIGRGVQNYTCASSESNPIPAGAIASLFDVTAMAFESATLIDAIPAHAVYRPVPEYSMYGFPVIGHHYFDSEGTPIFNLSTVQELLFVRKVANISAPVGASKGPAGTGAVDWLQLADKGGSVGCTDVYRVVTAGGSPPTSCMTPDTVTVDYAAEYWFYG